MPMTKLSITASDSEVRYGLVLITAVYLCIPSLLAELNSCLGLPMDTITLNFVYHVVNLVGSIAVFHTLLKHTFLQMQKSILHVLLYATIGLILYQVISELFSWIILSLKPDFTNLNDNNIAMQLHSRWIPVTISTVLMAPITEELLFRGVLFGRLYNKYPVSAYILSVCTFSLVHILGYLSKGDIVTLVLSFLQYLPAGVLLAWVYVKTDSIFTPILLHIMINAIGIYIMR